MSTWDPEQYLAYADERGRPFLDLVGRVGATDPRRVVDLGCGPGTLTTLLTRRWPGADVEGIDSSEEMVAAAPRDAGVRFSVGDVRTWSPADPVDVVVSNAVLQWVPDHLSLLPRLVSAVVPGGWLAFQVPGNFAEPSHTLRVELAAEPPYAEHTRAAARPAAPDARTYAEALLDLGCEVDAWETTYLHVLHGEDAVLDWIRGTSLRPTLASLPPGLREQFSAELGRRLRSAYPSRDGRVLLPFRRVFVVARTAQEPQVSQRSL